MKTLVVLTGPTGVGKTELSLGLAQWLGSPILNADSRQIYRELPIGTAAPTPEEQARVPHLFVGTHTLTDNYNAGQYERDALAALDDLFKTRDTVLMVGGAMLYIDAVCNGLDDIPAVPTELRERLRQQYRENGLNWLQQQVRQVDPIYFAQADICNPQRLLHALEITLHTGQPYSSFRHRTPKVGLNSPPKPGLNSSPKVGEVARSDGGVWTTAGSMDNSMSNLPRGAIVPLVGKEIEARPFQVLKIALTRPRPDLYARINARVDNMLQQGLLDEVRAVMPLRHLNALNTVGYKEMFRYLDGEWTLEQAADMVRQNSRHYAKRQLTWFRADPDMHWITLDNLSHNTDQIKQLIENQFTNLQIYKFTN